MNLKPKRDSIEIKVVNNGFVVRPAYDPAYCGQVMSATEFHVFETFEALSKWLKANLLPPMEGIDNVPTT